MTSCVAPGGELAHCRGGHRPHAGARLPFSGDQWELSWGVSSAAGGAGGQSSVESLGQAALGAMAVTTQGEAETCKLVSLVSHLEGAAGLRRHPSLPPVEKQPVQGPQASHPIPRALAGGPWLLG